MVTKICTVCKQEKDTTEYWQRKVNGRNYPSTYCKDCRRNRRREKIRTGEWKSSGDLPSGALNAERQKRHRQDPSKVGRFILEDSRKSDKKKGFDNDLTRSFIDEQVAKGCSYCGAHNLRMTLDRIDNTIGHIQTNVVPACIRCNLIRGNMPIDAWLVIARAVKTVVENGLFKEWGTSSRLG